MRVLIFENRNDAPMTLVIEPSDVEYALPSLSTVGVRYSPQEGEADRTYCAMWEGRIALWCDVEHEVEIVHPSAFDRLCDEMAKGGWCGGIVDGVPTSIDDLLPEAGMVSAETFAKLVVWADGWPRSDAIPEKHLRWLEGRFVALMGADAVDAQLLRRELRRPFEQR
jgi:hypothetical protein